MPIRVTGKGSALRFDGIDDYVEVDDSSSLRFGNGSFTVELWIKTSVAITRAAVIKRNGGKYSLGPRWTSRGIFSLNDGSDGDIAVEGTSIIIDEEWHHLASVCRRETNKMEIYVDGDFENDADITGLGNISPTGAMWVARGYWGSEFLKCDLDEIRTYNRALSAQEIKEHFNGVFRDESGLVLHLPFDEGEGTVAKDRSGYGNDGSIIGAEWVVKRNSRLLAATRTLAATRALAVTR